MPTPASNASPENLTNVVEWWNGSDWTVRLSDGQEVAGRSIAAARHTADRIRRNEFCPMSWRIVPRANENPQH